MKRMLFAALVVGTPVAAAMLPRAAANATPRAVPRPQPTVSDYQFISTSETPPTEAQCFSVGRRCFTPAGVRSAYDLQSLYDRGYDGRGVTIAIVDSWGSDTIRHDLHVYDTAFGLPPMCGEEGVTCQPGMIYKLASDPGRYANEFYDVTTGNNQADPSIPGYPATPGWDPVTGLGTPDAARLLPDLVQAVNNP